MAKAGDGKPRSNSRQRTETISLRMDMALKDRFQETAIREGYQTLSSWVLDRLKSDSGMAQRDRKIIIGMLGRQAEPLRKLIRTGVSASPETLTAIQKAFDAEAVAIQRLILKGGKGACEGDPEPQE